MAHEVELDELYRSNGKQRMLSLTCLFQSKSLYAKPHFIHCTGALMVKLAHLLTGWFGTAQMNPSHLGS